MSSVATVGTDEQLVVFRLGGESFGVDIFRVHEIIRFREITPIPQSETHIRGLVNLRGKTIPVVDLRIRFSMPEVEDTEKTRIIVVENVDGNVGIVVDEVNEVLAVSTAEIEPTPPLVADMAADYLRGVAKRDGRLITLLDLDKVLAN